MTVRTLWVQDLEGTAEQLNFAAFWKQASKSTLKAIDTSDFAYFAGLGDILIHLRNTGTYEFSTSSPAIVDDDQIIEPTTGGGHFKQMTTFGETAFLFLAPDIQETLAPVTATLDFSSISADSDSSALTITVSGARTGDFVQVQPPEGLESGLVLARAWVSAKNTVSIKLRNLTGSSIDPTSGNYSVLVTTQNRMPPLTKGSIELFEGLLNGDFDATSLEAALSDPINEAHFWFLASSRWRMQTLLDDAGARAAIEGSTVADSILTAIDGAGY